MSDEIAGADDMLLRPGEITIDLPDHFSAELYFIGRIRTPWRSRKECPRQGDRVAGPTCRIEIDTRYKEALLGIGWHNELQILYWMDCARRDIAVQAPRSRGELVGSFAVRSPVRPNPIASSMVTLLQIDGGVLVVRGLDCRDGTPLLDVKPNYCIER